MADRTSDSGSSPVECEASGAADQVGDLALATMIIDAARDLARTVPPPRGAPYFYLDTGIAHDMHVFDALSARGIFRKYEFALEIGCGLGGRARWLAARSSCRIVGVDSRVAAVRAAAMLNRRARMEDQVIFHVGRPDQLPLRERVFTHVWMLDDGCDSWPNAGFAEAFRVLRRGGHFALQRSMLSPSSRAELLEALCRVGFVELDVCETPLAEIPHAHRIACDRLRGALQHRPDLEALRLRVDTPPAERACVQIFARRPA